MELSERDLSKLRGIRHAIPEDVFKGADLAKYRVPIARHVWVFFPPTEGLKCRGCNLPLGGLLGTFTWGLAHGEGFCSHCRLPVRMYHRIELPGCDEPLTFTMPLQYHADGLSVRGES